MLESLFGTEAEKLKRKARGYYITYTNELDTLSCGASLGEQVNPRLLAAKISFNKTMDELAAIDPSCPKARL